MALEGLRVDMGEPRVDHKSTRDNPDTSEKVAGPWFFSLCLGAFVRYLRKRRPVLRLGRTTNVVNVPYFFHRNNACNSEILMLF